MFDAGFVWWLDSADLVQTAPDQQSERYEGDPWEELIGRWWMIARVCLSVRSLKDACNNAPRDCGHSTIRAVWPRACTCWAGTSTENGTARRDIGGVLKKCSDSLS